jgi:hypothetical protein
MFEMTKKRERAEGCAVTLDADTLLNDIIWQASRYCVGRTSYVSTNAYLYWQIIRMNRSKFDSARLRFFARDLRANISDVLHWRRGINVTNAYNDRIESDAYTLLMMYLMEHPSIDPKTTRFDIDCLQCTVTSEPLQVKLAGMDTMPSEFNSLLPWVMLADCIDRQYEVFTEYNGKKEAHRCILVYGYENQGYYSRFYPVDNLRAYIPQEYVVATRHIPYVELIRESYKPSNEYNV